MIAEHRAAVALHIGIGQNFRQSMAEKDVIAQHHRAGAAGQEILGQQIGLRQPVGRGLRNIGEVQPPLATIAHQALELGLILGGGDDRDLANAGQHQHAEGVIDHRFVIDRQQLFADAHGDRVKPRARSSGQDDALALHGFDASRSLNISRKPTRQSGRLRPKTVSVSALSSREFSGRCAGVG